MQTVAVLVGVFLLLKYGWPYAGPFFAALRAQFAPATVISPAALAAAPAPAPGKSPPAGEPPAGAVRSDRESVEHLLSAADRARAAGNEALATELLSKLPALAAPAEKAEG